MLLRRRHLRLNLGVIGVSGNNLDALPGARVVTIRVFLDGLGGRSAAAGIVDNLDALVVGKEWGLGKVGVATTPLNGAERSVLATGNPGTKLDLHRGLGEGGATLSSLVGQGADDNTVDNPLDRLGSPINRIGVKLAVGRGNRG